MFLSGSRALAGLGGERFITAPQQKGAECEFCSYDNKISTYHRCLIGQRAPSLSITLWHCFVHHEHRPEDAWPRALYGWACRHEVWAAAQRLVLLSCFVVLCWRHSYVCCYVWHFMLLETNRNSQNHFLPWRVSPHLIHYLKRSYSKVVGFSTRST